MIKKDFLEWLSANIHKEKLAKMDLLVFLECEDTELKRVMEEEEKGMTYLDMILSETFQKYDKRTREEIWKYMEQISSYEDIKSVVLHKDVQESGKVLEILEILKTAKVPEHSCCLAREKEVLANENGLKYIELLATAEEEYQSEYGYRAMYNTSWQILNNTNGLEYLKMITTAQQEFQAISGSTIISKILNNENGLEYMKMITTAQKGFQAECGCKTIAESEILTHSNGLEYMKLLMDTEQDFQAQCGCYAICKTDVLTYPNGLDYVKLITTAQLMKPSLYGYEALTNIIDPADENSLKCIKILTKARGCSQAMEAYSITCNPDFMVRKDSLKNLEMVANAKEYYQATYAGAALRNNMIYDHENGMKYVEQIVNAKEYYQAQSAYQAAAIVASDNKELFSAEQGLEIVQNMVNSPDSKAAQYGLALLEVINHKKGKIEGDYNLLINKVTEGEFVIELEKYIVQKQAKKLMEKSELDYLIELLDHCKTPADEKEAIEKHKIMKKEMLTQKKY